MQSGVFIAAGASLVITATQFSSAAISTGLGVHFTFDSSTVTNGVSGGPAGTVYNSPTYVAGKIGEKAISLSSASKHFISLGDYPNTGGTAITLATWIQVPSQPASNTAIINKFGTYGSGEREFRLNYNGNNINWSVAADPTNSSATSLNPALDTYNTWHHVVATFQGSSGSTSGSMVVYINGKQASSASTTIPSFNVLNGDTPLLIGAEATSTTIAATTGHQRYLSGFLDDIGIWNVARSAQEVAAVHAMGLFENLNLSDTRIDSLLTSFASQGSVVINGRQWGYTTGLAPSGASALGTTGGTAGSNAFVVLDSSGNGMQIVPEPTAAAALAAVPMLMVRRRRTVA